MWFPRPTQACLWGGLHTALPHPDSWSKASAPTSARKAVEVTLWTSYTPLCVAKSTFITRGSRGPANFAMALGRRHAGRGWDLRLPRAHQSQGPGKHAGLPPCTVWPASSAPQLRPPLRHAPLRGFLPYAQSARHLQNSAALLDSPLPHALPAHLASRVMPSSCPAEVLSSCQPPFNSMCCTTSSLPPRISTACSASTAELRRRGRRLGWRWQGTALPLARVCTHTRLCS